MKAQTAFRIFSLLLTASMLTACGGGDEADGTSDGTTATAVSQGVITAKGSVFVNGIEYSTTGATITIDDNPGIEDDLKVGMVVTVHGTSDDFTGKGTATQVEARNILEGTISSVDNVNKTITVMGQTVRFEDNVTRLNDDDTLKLFVSAAFLTGNTVEVHGFADAQGGVRATRVLNIGTGEFEIKGFVTAFQANSFSLALTPGGTTALVVNFVGGQFPPGSGVGSFVQVTSTAAPVANVITASQIQLEDSLGTAGQKVEVEGIVTVGTLASFVVNGQFVVTSASTVFEGGQSGDFAIGAALEAEGPLNTNGAIAATKITFRSNIKVEADASNVTGVSLTVLGQTVFINEFTRIDNGPVVNTSHVEVLAIPDRDGNLIATRIVVKNASTKAFLQGPVTAANSTAGILTILGTIVVSDGNTEWRASSTSTQPPVTKSAFFAQVRPNVTVVKVKWDPFSSTGLPIEEAEIEIGN